MPHLRSVDKGMFPLLREGVTSPMRTNLLLKSLKFRSFRGLRPLGPPPWRCPGPIGGLKTAPSSMLLKKKIHAPSNQNSWIRPWVQTPERSI